jgi:hypothetical protein
MRWRSVSLSACSAAVVAVAAGCGGGGGARLPVLTAVRLSDLAARNDCRGLIQAAIAAVNRGEVPPALQEPLLSAANACRFPSGLRP